MTACPVCGGNQFVKEAGFFYCSECQTQSQDLQDEVFDMGIGGAQNAVKGKLIKKKPRKRKGDFKDDDGLPWTSWDGYNYVLLGMTNELEAIGVPSGFKTQVLKLWAFLLRKIEGGFLSTKRELKPKLGLPFTERDAKILYGLNEKFDVRTVKKKMKIDNKTASDSEASTVSGKSSVISSRRRKSLYQSEYEESRTASQTNESSLANETLDTLGTSTEFETETSVSMKTSQRSMKTPELRRYQHTRVRKKKKILSYKEKRPESLKRLNKYRLLAVLHIALQMMSSPLRLTDLLRFIRDGNLSFSAVTHFFPKEFTIRKRDYFTFQTGVVKYMPNHALMRHVTSVVMNILQVLYVPQPDMLSLVSRYVQDLNLPDYFITYSERLLKFRPMKLRLNEQRTRFSSLPNYEGRAMAVVLFIFKLLFGLDDTTELMLSKVAGAINRCKDKSVDGELSFVFTDWQNYIECRKCFLSENLFFINQLYNQDNKNVTNTLSTQCVDSLLQSCCNMVRSKAEIVNNRNSLKKEFDVVVNDFLRNLEPNLESYEKTEITPSLTPFKCYTETLKKKFLNQQDGNKMLYPSSILDQEFNKTSLKFIMKPNRYLKILKKNNINVVKLNKMAGFQRYKLRFVEYLTLTDVPIHRNVENQEVKCEVKIKPKLFGEASENYVRKVENSQEKQAIDKLIADKQLILFSGLKNIWCLHYNQLKLSGTIMHNNFNNHIFKNLPNNFKWLLSEVSRMIEMNPKDLYWELIMVESMMTHVDGVTVTCDFDKTLFKEW